MPGKRKSAPRKQKSTPIAASKKRVKKAKRTAPASGQPRPQFLAVAAPTILATAGQFGCLPYPLAEALVYQCGSPEADGVPSSTTLGSLFRGGRLAAFCQCVKNGVPSPPPPIPCGPTSTLQDVINAIACK